MDDFFDPLRLHDIDQFIGLAQIKLKKRGLGRNRFPVSAGQVVDDTYFLPGGEQLLNTM